MSTYQELRAMLKCDPVDWASIAQRLGCSPEPLAVCAALLDQYGMKTYGPYIRCPYCTTITDDHSKGERKCRSCNRAHVHEYYSDPVKREMQREYFQTEHGREVLYRAARKYQAKNRDKIIEKQRVRREKHRDEYRAMWREQYARWKASHSPEERRAIWREQYRKAKAASRG